MTQPQERPPATDPIRRNRGPIVAVALTLIALLAAVVFGLQLGSTQAAPASPSAATTSAPAPSETPTPAATPEPAATKPPAALPQASAPTRLVVESADIDAPVLPLTPTENDVATQSIVPPETIDGYWLDNFGKPGDGADNTVYITGHSWEGRDSPFNRLSTDVEVGETVTLTTDKGTIDYVVDSVTTHNKDTLKDSDIWNIVPNRLVLISCFTEDLWGKNVIVTATPVAA